MDDDTKYLLDTNKANLDRTIGFISVMDGKAKFVLTLVLALTSYLGTQLSSFIGAHTRLNAMPGWVGALVILVDVGAVACLSAFLGAAIIALGVLRPTTIRHTGKASLFFFDTIADMPHEGFKQQVRAQGASELLDLFIDQTYDNAKIVQQKTRAVQRSMSLFFLGLGCFFLFTVGRTIVLGVYPPSSH